jgi:PEGA domain-containing protein
VIRHTLARRSLIALLVAFSLATLWPADALAQRAVRRPSGRSVVVVRPSYYRPFFYSPFYYPRYYWPYYYGGFYDPFFWGQYRYPPPYYGRYYYDDTGSARLQVTPRNAQVYVDGYFAGVVDDFDGSFQRLNVEAGEHELQFYLEGYRPFSLKVLFVRGRTVKVTHTMEPLGPGEPQPTPPKPVETARTAPYGGTTTPGRPRQMPGPARPGRDADFGSLLLRVRPSDATVLVDGEPWTAPEGDDQFVIELTEGQHRIEVRKNGFQTYSTTVRVRRGETVRLNVSLTAGGEIAGF